MIGYLRNTPGNIEIMLDDLASVLIIAKDGNGAVYWPAYSLNIIGDMVPGRGYQIKLSDAATLVYPPNSVVYQQNKFVSRKIPAFYNEIVNTGNNMTVCIPTNAFNSIPPIGSEIAVKDENGNIVGASVYNGGNTVITIWGDDELSIGKDGLLQNEDLSFYIWDNVSNIKSELDVEYWIEGEGKYEINGIAVVGKLSLTKEQNKLSVGVFPNPFINETQIIVDIPTNSKLRVELLDVNSNIIRVIADNKYDEGEYKFNLQSYGLSPGIYQVRVQTLEMSKSIFVVLIK